MIGLSLFLIYLNFAIISILPYPFSHINIIFLAIILFILSRESTMVVWLSLILFFIADLSGISPFGLTFFSGVTSVLCTYWFYSYVFTNRSWHSAIALSVISIFTFRLLNFLLYILAEYSHLEFHFNWHDIIKYYILEISITSLFVGAVVFVLSKKWSRFKKERISY